MYIPGYYEFCNRVKVVSGHKALDKLPEMLKSLKSSRPMIVTDKGVMGAGLIEPVKKALGTKLKAGAYYDNVPADSDVKVVLEITKLYRSSKCDSLIAIGGGSVMDTAKGVNILVSENSDNLMDFTGAGALKRPLKPLIAVPTTSGTGSEMTIVAVIADHARDVKMLFPSLFLLPDMAILDSRMTKTLPPFLTAPTAMDAMTHAVEAYTCLAKNPLSDVTAITAIQLISRNVLTAVSKPGDLKARLALANGSTLAGMSFSNSMVGMVHQIGHSIGAICHVAHGTCMSILLPYGLEYNLHKTGHLTAELLFPLAGDEVYAGTPLAERPLKTIAYIRELNSELHKATGGKHFTCLKEIVDRNGNMVVPKEKLPEIAKLSLNDGSGVQNPEELDYDDILMVLEHAWEGTPLNLKKIKKGKKTSKIKVKS
ncbi:MAG TPA: iron-containing alcohol dehydrogenase [Spirochaetota bacterium]|nr:iron-containing alcohol dehydrogenase [Spirochaetota bacterium]HPS87690.1 iron-containing alcohol dehydrogenase [Spirochaetota bacterium]